jgi:RNA polymerase sigma-70 factor, ECF subfamily
MRKRAGDRRGPWLIALRRPLCRADDERRRAMPVSAEEVYDRFDADLGAFVRSRVRDPDAADDVLQEIYLKIHSRIGTVKDDEKIAPWVFRVARNTVIDFYRSYRPTEELVEVPEAPTDPEGEGLQMELSRAVRDMMEGLSPEHRKALHLTEYDGLTQKELAHKLGISLSGAKSRVQRARTRLKAMLLDCCHFELDRRGKVLNYYDHAFAPDDGVLGEP